MNIKLNGYMCVNNDEYYFEDLEIKDDEDIDIPFDDIDDFGISGFGKGYDEVYDEDDYTEDCDSDCDGNCYDCEYGEEDDEDDDVDLNPLEKLIEEYAEFLVDENLCIDCVKNVLENFVYELISEED